MAHGDFVHDLCAKMCCSPNQLDFSQCRIIPIGDESVFEQIDYELVNEFLSTITYATHRRGAEEVLRAFFDYSLDRGVLRYSPALRRRSQNMDVSQRTINLDDFEELIRNLRKFRHPYGFALLVQETAGLRVGEILALRTEDVFLTNNNGWAITIQRE